MRRPGAQLAPLGAQRAPRGDDLDTAHRRPTMKAMRIDFAGGTVIVTGGSGALGGAVVQGFLEAAARVLATYVVEAEVAPFRERFAGQKARVELRRYDLCRADEVAALLGRVAPDSLRAVVNLAGGYPWTRVADADDAALEHLLDLICTAFTVCRGLRRCWLPPAGARS